MRPFFVLLFLLPVLGLTGSQISCSRHRHSVAAVAGTRKSFSTEITKIRVRDPKTSNYITCELEKTETLSSRFGIPSSAKLPDKLNLNSGYGVSTSDVVEIAIHPSSNQAEDYGIMISPLATGDAPGTAFVDDARRTVHIKGGLVLAFGWYRRVRTDWVLAGAINTVDVTAANPAISVTIAGTKHTFCLLGPGKVELSCCDGPNDYPCGEDKKYLTTLGQCIDIERREGDCSWGAIYQAEPSEPNYDLAVNLAKAAK